MFQSANLLFSIPFPVSSLQLSVCQSSILSNLPNGNPGISQLVIDGSRIRAPGQTFHPDTPGALSQGWTQGGSQNPSKFLPVPRTLANSQNDDQGTPKGAKEVSIGHHFRLFWSSRWKCENDGFVYTKPSFSWLEGVPNDSRSLPKSISKN